MGPEVEAIPSAARTPSQSVAYEVAMSGKRTEWPSVVVALTTMLSDEAAAAIADTSLGADTEVVGELPVGDDRPARMAAATASSSRMRVWAATRAADSDESIVSSSRTRLLSDEVCVLSDSRYSLRRAREWRASSALRARRWRTDMLAFPPVCDSNVSPSLLYPPLLRWWLLVDVGKEEEGAEEEEEELVEAVVAAVAVVVGFAVAMSTCAAGTADAVAIAGVAFESAIAEAGMTCNAASAGANMVL
jgi:hypothetical protein